MAKSSFEKYIEESLKKNPVLEEKLHKAELALDIAHQIYNLRQKKGLTQEELAGLIKVKQSNIARLENAEYSGYSLRTLQKIAKALDTNLNIFITTPEQTSSLLNCLYNAHPTVTKVRSLGQSIFISWVGSVSLSDQESILTNLLSDFENIGFTTEPVASSNCEYKYRYINF